MLNICYGDFDKEKGQFILSLKMKVKIEIEIKIQIDRRPNDCWS